MSSREIEQRRIKSLKTLMVIKNTLEEISLTQKEHLNHVEIMLSVIKEKIKQL